MDDMEDVKCHCGGNLMEFHGPFGTFIACDRYRETGCPTKLTPAKILRFLKELVQRDPDAILEALGGAEGILDFAVRYRSPQYVWWRLRPELAQECLERYGVHKRKSA